MHNTGRKKLATEKIAALVALLAFCGGGQAFAHGKIEPPDGTHFPVVAGQVELKLQSESHSSPFRELDRNEHFFEGEGSAGLFLNDRLSLLATLAAERVKRARTTSRSFGGTGVFVEQLFVNYGGHGYSLLAGKYNPKFGMAHEAAPGLYGAEFAEGYELTEGIGISGSYELVHDEVWGEHEITAGVFFLDNTPLSRSFLTTPTFRAFQTTERIGQRRLYAGKPGNTYAPQSYSIVLEGEGMAALPDLKYQIGYRQLQRGTNDQQINDYASRDERGFAAGAAYVFDLGSGVQLTPLIEYVRLSNAHVEGEGPDGQPAFGHVHFLSTALSLDYDGWKLSASRSQRDKNAYNPGVGNQGSHLVTSSLEYDFGNGFGAGIGWARIKEKPELNGEAGTTRISTVGTRLTYLRKF